MRYKNLMKKIHAGLSTEDSVSYVVDGYVVSSIRDRAGENYSCVFKYPGHSESKEKLDKTMDAATLILFLLISFMMQNIVKGLFGSMGFILALEIIVLVIFTSMLSKSLEFMQRKNPRIFKFHGAEHKVFNAANKKGDIPTLEEAKKASTFCPWCGVKVYSIIISLTIVNIILAAFNLYVIPFGLVLSAGYLLPGYDPIGFYLQKRKTTAEPTDSELEVALKAFSAAYEISNGREPYKDEEPTIERSFDFLCNLNARLGPNDKLSYEDICQLEAFKERLDIENEILENIYGTLIR
ncbi:MAG: DUF1385 domain-containing protein [Clostridia bacterium]|nr:DUF1385 domain-containing protein [Clostridia bacterium]